MTCTPGGDEEAFIEDVWMLVVKGIHCPSSRLQHKAPQAPPWEEQISKTKGVKKQEATKNEKEEEGRGQREGSCCHTVVYVPMNSNSQPSGW